MYTAYTSQTQYLQSNLLTGIKVSSIFNQKLQIVFENRILETRIAEYRIFLNMIWNNRLSDYKILSWKFIFFRLLYRITYLTVLFIKLQVWFVQSSALNEK